MRISGWLRIWIVLSLIYAIIVTVFAYNSKPSVAYVHNQWFSDAAEIVAKTISNAEGQYISPYDVQEKFMANGTTAGIEWLERIERTPKPAQKIFSKKIGVLNDKYRHRISNFPQEQFVYWLQALGWWLGGILLLFIVGWTVGWVVRGFRVSAT